MQHSQPSLRSGDPVRIGARGSKLSQIQAYAIQAQIVRLLGADPADAEKVAPVILITTTGDRVQDRRLLEIGGKALFTKEIEEALLENRIDCAVHCLKDMPAISPPGLVTAAHPEREDPRDALISPIAARIEDLPQGARLGTASLRRQAQSLFRRPDLSVHLLRGNVDTRLAKLDEGFADAIILAYAGLRRMGLESRVAGLIDPYDAPPAPGQGALTIQTRAADIDHPALAGLHHVETGVTVAAERGALEALEGSCKTAVGAYATMKDGRLSMIVEGLAPDGANRWRREGVIDVNIASLAARDDAFRLGLELGAAVRADGGDLLTPAG
jgi:hydroxymethylbilane synthase